MLPDAAIHVADRLITALMTLLESVGVIAVAATRTPTAHGQAAQILFFRLTTLVTTLMRISNFGIRRPRELDPDLDVPDRTPPDPAEPPTRSDRAPSLPRRPGWLLDLLPDIAPAVAADLGLLVADPAFAALLDAAPTLNRILRPLLRALGLAATPSPDVPSPTNPPPARPTAPRHPAAPPRHPDPRTAEPTRRNRPPEPGSLHDQFIT